MSEKEIRRHKFIWAVFRILVKLPIFLKFNFHGKKLKPDSQFILLANHNTDWDPLLLGSVCKNQMYFVASEHVYAHGFASRLLRRYLAPIPRVKGSVSAAPVLEILRRIRAGHNIAIFAEGNRSFDGLTCPITPATGALVRRAGVTLYTYRFSGGYLSSPRWSRGTRRGKIIGEPVRAYTPEQLRNMTVDEINAAIAADLAEDAYATQSREMTAFHGRRLAESLETMLFVCPACGNASSMKSKDDRFFCTACGNGVTYSKYGFFEGSGRRFDTVTEWDKWQRSDDIFLPLLTDTSAFTDDNVRLLIIGAGGSRSVASEGRLSLTGGALTVGERHIPLADISDADMHGRQTLVFTAGVCHYEISSPDIFCARKYLLALTHYIRQREKAKSAGRSER